MGKVSKSTALLVVGGKTAGNNKCNDAVNLGVPYFSNVEFHDFLEASRTWAEITGAPDAEVVGNMVRANVRRIQHDENRGEFATIKERKEAEKAEKQKMKDECGEWEDRPLRRCNARSPPRRTNPPRRNLLRKLRLTRPRGHPRRLRPRRRRPRPPLLSVCLLVPRKAFPRR